MKDFDHLMSVWQAQPKKDQLSVEDVLKQVKKGINGMSSKLFWNITGMVACLLGLFAAVLFFVFTSWVTYLGIFIILITMALYIMMMVRDYRIINKQDVTTNPTEYLQSLKEYQKNRTEVYGWLYYLYVLLMSTGLLLYFFEVLQSASPQFKTIAYGSYILFILFCSFYIRSHFVKNEQEKLDLLIDRLVRLQEQFN